MKVDFFIVGAPKAGTTSLYHYLNEHPEIEMSSQKEPDFFTDLDIYNSGMYYGKNRINTIEKYHNLFGSRSKLRGEASVSYLFNKNVPQKIKTYNPDAKIIIMLRNPVERAFSHYLMDYRLGLVSDAFEDIVNRKKKNNKNDLFYQQYIEVSVYSKQVKRYLNVFEKENILIIDYIDFKEDISEVLDRLFQFIGVSTDFEPNVEKKHNPYSMPKNKIIRFIYSFVALRKVLKLLFSKTLAKKARLLLFKEDKKPKLSKALRLQLNKYFKNDIERLGKLLDKDYLRWIK